MSYIGGPLPGQEREEVDLNDKRLLGSRLSEQIYKGVDAIPKDQPWLNAIGKGLSWFADNSWDENWIKGEEALLEKVGEYAPKVGIDPLIAQLAAGVMIPGPGEGRTVKRTFKQAHLLKNTAQEIAENAKYIPGTGPLDVPVRSKNRTRLTRNLKSGKEMIEIRNSPVGIQRVSQAMAYKQKHGNLEGFSKTVDPWILPDGDEIKFKSTNTGVRLKRKSDAQGATTMRTTNEWLQTHGDQDWNKVVDGYTDPKDLPLEKIEGHHKHMVEGYDWSFAGLKKADAEKITKHFFDRGSPLGKTQFNRNNLPRPVHKALHAWMDKQMGLNGLDMPSLRGMSVKQRIKHLEVYIDFVQPVMDEATFSLMKRYKELGNSVKWNTPGAYKKLFKENVQMSDQFTDAFN